MKEVDGEIRPLFCYKKYFQKFLGFCSQVVVIE